MPATKARSASSRKRCGIHVLDLFRHSSWMAGSSPAMTPRFICLRNVIAGKPLVAMATTPKKMSLSSLKAMLASEKADALAAMSAAQLSGERARAQDYYLGGMDQDMPA